LWRLLREVRAAEQLREGDRPKLRRTGGCDSKVERLTVVTKVLSTDTSKFRSQLIPAGPISAASKKLVTL